jgi:MFS family permease
VDRRWLRLGLVLAVFVNNANFSATTVALPSVQHSLGLGFTGLQWTMTSYLLAYSACMLPGGRLSDAIGVRAVLACGIALYLGAMLVVASAMDLPTPTRCSRRCRPRPVLCLLMPREPRSAPPGADLSDHAGPAPAAGAGRVR